MTDRRPGGHPLNYNLDHLTYFKSCVKELAAEVMRNWLSLLLSAALSSPMSEFISLSRGDQVEKEREEKKKLLCLSEF